ncbi:MAG: YdcF family protein [Clostridia bacterium]|nr:YdcF family protein [Clostridia bacterium]
MKKLFAFLGAVLIVYGIVLSLMSNFNVGIVMILALGAVLFIYGLFYKRLDQHGAMRVIEKIVIAALCVEAVLVGFIAYQGVHDTVSYNEDAVIVLGAGVHGDRVSLPLKQRLDKALEYHEKNPEAVIVVTGGRGFQETVTEAEAMEKYLLEKGVKPESVLKEENATSTNENMKFSKVILDNRFGDEYSVAVITNNFHIYRSVRIAKNEGFKDVKHLHAGLQWYNLMPCYLRESLAVIKLLILV